jgi:hypothetical protein
MITGQGFMIARLVDGMWSIQKLILRSLGGEDHQVFQ